jgi:hypothetical protein
MGFSPQKATPWAEEGAGLPNKVSEQKGEPGASSVRTPAGSWILSKCRDQDADDVPALRLRHYSLAMPYQLVDAALHWRV